MVRSPRAKAFGPTGSAGFVAIAMALAVPATAAPHHGAAHAPAPTEQSSAADVSTGQPTHPEGAYGGVSPEHPGGQEPGHKQKKPRRGELSWIGFQAKAGGAQIFLQSAAAFELSQHVEGNTLVIDTPLAQLGPNTWRDVDTRFFDSPIAHVSAKRVGARRATKTAPARGSGIEVRVVFKNARDAHEGTLRTATEADGLFYAYLSFPAPGESAQPSLDEPEK